MKIPALLLFALLSVRAGSFAQGPLTPPGAPAPTMKTLAQIEARTPIDPAQPGFTLPYTISTPGSYYLTADLLATSATSGGDAIIITVNGVTLDLNGFSIASNTPNGMGSGVVLNGNSFRDITICNGHIRSGVTASNGVYSGNGFRNGITNTDQSVSYNVRVVNVSVTGCLDGGIYLEGHGCVEGCSVDNVGGIGIYAEQVKACSASPCGTTGISAGTASDCMGTSSLSSGINAEVVINSKGDGAPGIYAGTANNCSGNGRGNLPGIQATVATGCQGSVATGAGIIALNAQNCYGLSSNGTGVSATNAQSCYGIAYKGTGVVASNAQNCYGQSNNGIGIKCVDDTAARGVATACYGAGTTVGINAFIANGCTGTGTVPISASHSINSF